MNEAKQMRAENVTPRLIGRLHGDLRHMRKLGLKDFEPCCWPPESVSTWGVIGSIKEPVCTTMWT